MNYGQLVGPPAQDLLAEWDTPWRRRFQRKAWLYVGVFDPKFTFGMAVVDVGYLGLAFAYYADLQTGVFIEEKAQRLFAFPGHFTPNLASPWSFRAGAREWEIRPAERHVLVRFTGKRIRTEFRIDRMFPGITAIAPAGNRPFNMTHKVVALPTGGKMSVDGITRDFDAYGALDWTLGYPPRRINWEWACLAGKSADGETLGINLVAQFNEGLENALFIDGKAIKVGAAHFTVGTDRAKDEWLIRADEPKLEIRLRPAGARRDNMNLLVVKNRFTQAYGSFDAILERDGRPTKFTGYGVAEEHFALW